VAQYPDEFVDVLLELSRLMPAEEALEVTLNRVAGLARRTISACDAASVTLARAHGPTTAASTNAVASALDEAQYGVDDGPCLHAYRTCAAVAVPDMGAETRWAAFTDTAAQRGVGSSLSLPLLVREAGTGALNLYAYQPGAFRTEDVELGLLFAAQAAVAIANAEVYWRVYNLTQNLEAALHTRDVIGQAKGIIMTNRRVTSDAAFDLLRRASQRTNLKLHDLAQQIAATGDTSGI
jgi:GAF domain-containing protein